MESSEVNPPRPGYGGKGSVIKLQTNYFKLAPDPTLELYRYRVTIPPDRNGIVPVGKKAKRIVQLLLTDHFRMVQSYIATDFRSTLISRKKLTLNRDYYDVIYRVEGVTVQARNATSYRCRVEPTGSLTLSELMDYLTSTQAGLMLGSKDEIIQALNIVVGHFPKAAESVATVATNRHFASRPEAQDRASLGAGLEVIRVFFMSVRAATARILVNVQVKNTAFYEQGGLDKLMTDFLEANDLNTDKLLEFVENLSIEVTHRKNSQGDRVPIFKTVLGLATTADGSQAPNPPKVRRLGAGAQEVQFFLNDSSASSVGKSTPGSSGGGKQSQKGVKAGPAPPSAGGRYITVFDFFKEKCNLTIRDPKLPVINVGGKENPSYLPAEVCKVRPGQPAKKKLKLSSAQTMKMINFAVRRPPDNVNSIVGSGRRLLGFEPTNGKLTTFNTNVPPELITVGGRVLNGPDIKYTGSTIKPVSGSWNLRSMKLANTTRLSWTYLRIIDGTKNPFQSERSFQSKLNELHIKLRDLGIRVEDSYRRGRQVTLESENVNSKIDELIRQLAALANRAKLLLVIIPEKMMTAIYNRVKYTCDVKWGILNVCVLDYKLEKANQQYLANVAMKFNLKLGGWNHTLDPAKLGIVRSNQTMIVGIDVTHPVKGSSPQAPSVAGIVASVDGRLGQWPAAVQVQAARQEMVSGLEDMFKSRLKLWWERNNKTLPRNILIYRDGVSEGQYDIVLKHELPALRKACETLYPPQDTKAKLPLLTIVIVGKRHNTRFYKEPKEGGGNPDNGTVVDRSVTEARNWDFFLQSHTPVKGTARPAHYYVVYDQIFRTLAKTEAANALEDLTHNLCYLFGRATKAVSICPPAYYADLLCTRARCYLTNSLYDPSSTPSSQVTSSSSSSSSGPGPGQQPQRPPPPPPLDATVVNMVKIHDGVKDAMFYI
ncbi:putative RNA interference and gene silencing protein [Xylariomycetidae sp. FL2044]|nr:putative RNA interference and gene silencing protein [Xylariomycetidae sp. FL2044]